MAVAEEVHYLYPESEWALSRLKDDPGHLLFKRYGDQVPEGDWNHPGTKQGIYMMGPGGEYLEGAHAASGSASRLAERLERALERWDTLRREKGYRNRPVPAAQALAPPEVARAAFPLRVFLRDLPRGEGDDSGRRVTAEDRRGKGWMQFIEWAWNQNWVGLDDPAAFVPKGRAPEEVDARELQQLVRRALVDNVRGQNPAWKAEAVKTASLGMREVGRKGALRILEYDGRAQMDDGTKRYAATLVGRAEWHVKERRFRSFRLVAVGERAGAARFNQRAKDKAPAPMGVLIELAPTEVRSAGADERKDRSPK